MKVYLLFILFALILGMGDFFNKKESRSEYSKVYLKYKKEFQSLYVSSIQGNGIESYRIVGNKSGKWSIIDVYPRKSFSGADSVIKKDCTNCYEVDSIIRANDIVNLRTEKDIELPCITSTNTTSRIIGNPDNFNDLSGAPDYIIEFKIRGSERRIKYKSPRLALKHCPESEERKRMLRIIGAIKWAKGP